MARIAGVDLPREKRVEIGLTYIYGIGLKSSQKILSQTGINPDTRVKDLTEADVSKLREVIDAEYTVEGDLRRQLALDIKRLMEEDKTQRTMQEPVRVLQERLQVRRNKGGTKLNG